MPLHTEIPILNGSWRIDRTRSTVDFLIRKMGVATLRGTFASFDARIADAGPHLRIAGRVDVASVDTHDEIRDRRLREEFFDVERFPAIGFEAVSATPVLDGTWRLDGELTIRDTTRPVTLAVRPELLDDGCVRLRAEGRITRSEFGLEWDALSQAGRLLVGDHVRLIADVVIERF
jgi:polyisoprenoid-binding protein YceI